MLIGPQKRSYGKIVKKNNPWFILAPHPRFAYERQVMLPNPTKCLEMPRNISNSDTVSIHKRVILICLPRNTKRGVDEQPGKILDRYLDGLPNSISKRNKFDTLYVSVFCKKFKKPCFLLGCGPKGDDVLYVRSPLCSLGPLPCLNFSMEQSQNRYMVSGSLCPLISFSDVSY